MFFSSILHNPSIYKYNRTCIIALYGHLPSTAGKLLLCLYIQIEVIYTFLVHSHCSTPTKIPKISTKPNGNLHQCLIPEQYEHLHTIIFKPFFMGLCLCLSVKSFVFAAVFFTQLSRINSPHLDSIDSSENSFVCKLSISFCRCRFL